MFYARRSTEDILNGIIKKIIQRFKGLFNDTDRVIVEALNNKINKDEMALAKQVRGVIAKEAYTSLRS